MPTESAWPGQNDIAFEYLERAIDREGPELVQAIKRASDLYGPITADPAGRRSSIATIQSG